MSDNRTFFTNGDTLYIFVYLYLSLNSWTLHNISFIHSFLVWFYVERSCQMWTCPPHTGASGCGSYHGRWGFETFSHRRACMLRGWALERLNALRYPPYNDDKLSWLRWTARTSCSLMWGVRGMHRGLFSVGEILRKLILMCCWYLHLYGDVPVCCLSSCFPYLPRTCRIVFWIKSSSSPLVDSVTRWTAVFVLSHWMLMETKSFKMGRTFAQKSLCATLFLIRKLYFIFFSLRH